MAGELKIYRRLPGRGTTLAHYVRLFQGPDHLLQVSSTGYSEFYKRFYYRDIQAIIVRQTHLGKLWSAVWGFPAGLFGAIALVVQLNGGNGLALWIIAAVFVPGLAINLALGPTCACHVRTAVQIEKLPSLKRLRGAQKFIERLRPILAAVQGELNAEDIRARPQSPVSASPPAQAAAPPVLEEPQNVPPAVSGGA